MLAVFLSILKVACIVLAIVLLIAILLVLLVLFVPIRYRIKGNYPETVFKEGEGVDKDKVFLSVKFSWLLHILSGKFLYPKRPEFVIRVFGIKIFPRKEKKIKEKYNDEKSGEKFGDSELSVTEKDNLDETNISRVEPIEKENTELNQEVNVITEEKLNIDDDETFFDKLKKVAETALELIKMPKRVFEKNRYTISRVCDKIRMIKSTLENDIFKRAYSLVKDKLIRLLKMILPDKSRIELYLGMGDSATEAELMSVYGILYPVLYDKLKFTPDFENRALGADLDLKGHITVFTVIYCIAVCYFNKDVKKVINRFKKIMNS
ncbi:hypothetical protein [Butyrivibrio sp. LB2008]|uniref:hypothetical protein n=1 Tax=Butyrivibrio sp. LB2008 TaxID=1408305 RepID=UPI00047C7B35|nr:hypothetical protein [Butyrivibrio sp. LB2008]